jgi:hypothetical protein
MGLPVEILSNLIGSSSTVAGYQISRSIRFRPSASATFTRTPSVTGNRRTFTFSTWVKRGKLGTSTGLFMAQQGTSNGNLISNIGFGSDDKLFFDIHTQGTLQIVLGSTVGVFRDPSAWYHIVVAINTLHATNSDGVKIYVNGVQQTLSFSNYTQNADSAYNTINYPTYFARYWNDGSTNSYADCHMTETYLIDGLQLTPSSFGETDSTTGVWEPKAYSGSYSTNGFYLNFSDNSAATAAALGKDSSGNGNNYTPTNISLTAGVTYDSMTDTPTLYADGDNGRGNYSTGNPLFVDSGAYTTWSNGNLDFSVPNAGKANSTLAASSGKWYAELIYATNALGGGVAQAGITSRFVRAVQYGSTGQKNIDGTTSSYGSSFTNGDVIGIALNMDAGEVTFYKNNVSQGAISLSGASIDSAVFCLYGGGAVTSTGSFNFGQRPFVYTPPSGFKALNTQNLSTPTIVKGSSYIDATTYTGNATTGTPVVNSGSMRPDFVWIATRNTTGNHMLYDSLRGADLPLYSNLTNIEGTAGDSMTAFNSNGFTLGSSAATNGSGNSYVGWQWKEGAIPGFDIVSYTGNSTGSQTQNISHNLGVVPSCIIVKNRAVATNWPLYHTSIGAGSYLYLNGTAASASDTTMWNNTSPTSSVFTVGTNGQSNNNGNAYVAYLWAQVEGFSRFSSYTGNGNADGPVVWCGFRPKYVMIKRSTTSGESWGIFDSARNLYNETNLSLYANLTTAEGSGAGLDFLSSGFKIRTTNALCNSSSATYIFMAFAENPFKYALAR